MRKNMAKTERQRQSASRPVLPTEISLLDLRIQMEEGDLELLDIPIRHLNDSGSYTFPGGFLDRYLAWSVYVGWVHGLIRVTLTPLDRPGIIYAYTLASAELQPALWHRMRWVAPQEERLAHARLRI